MNQTNFLDLRPLSVAELFDRSFRLYRNNFGTFLGIMLLTQVPIYLFNIVLTALVGTSPANNGSLLSQQLVGTAVVASIVAGILSLVFTQVGAAALTKGISDSYLGRKIEFWDAFQRIGGTWFTLIFASFAAGLLIVGLALPLWLIFMIPCGGPIIGLIGFIALIAVANVLISLIPPVVVLEKRGVSDSVKRAWALAKLRFWWSFGYLFLLGLLSLMVISGPVALIEFLFATVLGETSPIFQTIVQETASSLLSAIFMPIRLAAITLMYFDLRIRFEGFDLMVLAAANDAPLDDAADLPTQTTL